MKGRDEAEKKRLGAEVKRLREKRGWTRRDELLVQCRNRGGTIGFTEIVRIEQGKVKPRLHTQEQIAAAATWTAASRATGSG
jgi:transcriptional regulator with XRE-family HTH domain